MYDVENIVARIAIVTILLGMPFYDGLSSPETGPAFSAPHIDVSYGLFAHTTETITGTNFSWIQFIVSVILTVALLVYLHPYDLSESWPLIGTVIGLFVLTSSILGWYKLYLDDAGLLGLTSLIFGEYDLTVTSRVIVCLLLAPSIYFTAQKANLVGRHPLRMNDTD